jgi:hypothetical protein
MLLNAPFDRLKKVRNQVTDGRAEKFTLNWPVIIITRLPSKPNTDKRE